MKILTTLIFITILLSGYSQTYDNPGGTTSTCSGTFRDTGGGAGTYSSNENITTTFCSNAGNCVRVTFSAFNIENGWDFLYVYDGPTIGSPLIGTYTGTTSPGTITSTTGCLTFQFISDNTVTAPGWQATISCVACPAVADYIHPTVGINNEYVGACLVNDCGPFTYADNGNLTGNYSNNINQIYRVFCPDQAGQCMQVTFNSFRTYDNRDFLQVKNGPTQNSTNFLTPPIATSFFGAGYEGLFGNLNGVTPFGFTSTDSSGCLTFRFYSNGANTSTGWDATLQCVPCAVGPTGTENTDCTNATPLCATTSFGGNSTGPGLVSEGCTGSTCPAGGENHSNWYTFTANTSGSLTFNISPNNPADDYDYNLFGPNVTCGNLGLPLRCSDSGTGGNTGLNFSATDFSEDVTGDKFTQYINVIAGETYFLVVDKWSPAAASGYQLSFGGSATLDCTVLPVELVEFNAEYVPEDDVVDITWSTASERNCERFDVERSLDGVNFEVIHQVSGAGNTDYLTKYFVTDPNPNVGVNYYKINQWDFDGKNKYSEVVAVNILDDVYDMLSLFPNPTTGKTDVIFNSYSQGEAILNVVGADGKVIVNTPVAVSKGGNKLSLDMTGQGSGLYVLSIVTKDKVYKARLIVK